MGMGSLRAAAKDSITAVLNNTGHSFSIKYDDQNDPAVTITFSAFPECQFLINSGNNDSQAFTTIECPGVRSDSAETFQRDSFELCIIAIKEWAKRAIEKQKDWILDEFGGVADMNPFLNR